MPYHVGAKGSYGCEGYPAVKDDGTVMGCHKSKVAAARQIYAINVSEGNIGKAMVKEGDMVMAGHDDEIHIGRVVHVMTEGMLGSPGSEYAIMASPEEPAILMQLFEMEEGGLEETEYFMGHRASEVMLMPSLESNVGMDKSMNEDISKSYHSDNEEEDKWDNMNKACWVGYEQQGMKEKDGRMVPNCVPVSKGILANAPYQDANSEREMEEEDEEIEEARRRMVNEELGKAKGISVGDHVMFAVPKPPDKTESAHGVVERVERSGTVKLPGTNESIEASSDNPVAVVRVYATDDNGKRTRTDRRVVKPFSSLRTSSEPIENKMYDEDEEMTKASAKVESRLRELAETYNKGKDGDKKITVGALRQVYNRGIGAYRTNPSSVRGSVSSAEQWAMGRVNAFMAGLRGRFPRKPFDLDLFPSGHPRSTKKSIFEDFGKENYGAQQLTEVFMDTEKREFSGATRERMAESGTAMPDGSFPIGNRADLMNAIRSVGRAKNYDAAKQHIIRRARALNAMDMLPEDWRNKATKGMGEWSGSIFDLNPFIK
jgi:hypothetical protein